MPSHQVGRGEQGEQGRERGGERNLFNAGDEEVVLGAKVGALVILKQVRGGLQEQSHGPGEAVLEMQRPDGTPCKRRERLLQQRPSPQQVKLPLHGGELTHEGRKHLH